MGTGVWSFNAYKHLDLNEIVGSLGKLSFSTFSGDLRIETADGEVQEVTIPNPPHVQQPLIQKIVDDLRGIGQSPSTGVTAARTNRVMDELLRDFYRV
ncbi:hypothetical protein D3C85_1634540 [compost metagenome]